MNNNLFVPYVRMIPPRAGPTVFNTQQATSQTDIPSALLALIRQHLGNTSLLWY